MAISKYGLVLSAGHITDESVRSVVEQQAGQIEQALDAHLVAARAIEASPELTDEGRIAAMKRLRDTTAARFTTLHREHVRVRERLTSARERLDAGLAKRFDPAPVSDDPAHRDRQQSRRLEALMTQREVRDRLLAIPEEQRIPIAMRAAIENDLTTLAAIANAPAVAPILPTEMWRDVAAEHARRHCGDAVAELETLNNAIVQLDANFNTGLRMAGIVEAAQSAQAA